MMMMMMVEFLVVYSTSQPLVETVNDPVLATNGKHTSYRQRVKMSH